VEYSVKTIYTAIIGDYDDLKEPFIVTPGWKYVCFTDQDIKSDVWEIRKINFKKQDDQKTARYIKINFHEFVDTIDSIWIDATFIINTDLNEWWERHQYPFTTIKHPFDDCIYKDIQSCAKGGKASPVVLKNQKDLYQKLGVPKHNGLIASGILMRTMTPETILFCRQWWKQVEAFSGRDQIAFGYVNYKLPNFHKSIEWDYTQHEQFIHIAHLSKKWRWVKLVNMRNKYGITGS
jgi:hypothetical protein